MGQAGHWDGPYDLLTIEGETCMVNLPNGPTAFQTTVMKPYLQADQTNLEEEQTLRAQNNDIEPVQTPMGQQNQQAK